MSTIEYIKETLSHYYSVRSIKSLTRPSGALYGKFSYFAGCGYRLRYFVICNGYISTFPTAAKMMQYINNNKI